MKITQSLHYELKQWDIELEKVSWQSALLWELKGSLLEEVTLELNSCKYGN